MPQIRSGLIYRPCQTLIKGKSLYEGEPCPTKEAYELLQEKGIKEIREVLRNIIRVKKLLCGTLNVSDYALTNYQSFDHYPSLARIVIEDPFSIEEWEMGESEELFKIDVLNTEQRREKLLALRTPKQELQFPKRLKNDDLYFISLQGKSSLNKSEVLRRLLEYRKT